MVAVFNKDLLSWYLLTLKVNELATETSHQVQNSNGNSEAPIAATEVPIVTKPVPDWVIAIRDKLNQAENEEDTAAWGKLCIYRIPEGLRNNEVKAYIPQTVSLGPYHHGDERLRNMEPHKWRAVHHVLKRTDKEIEVYLDAMKELEERARACYEGPISLTSSEFIEMMVVDGCFILELFRGAALGFTDLGYSRSDPVFAMRGVMHSIQRDMIMLENQIPFFILDKLYSIQMNNADRTGDVSRLALYFFDPLIPSDEPLLMKKGRKPKIEPDAIFDPLTDQGGLHCLDVFRRNLLAASEGAKPAPRVWISRWSQSNRVVDKRKQQLIYNVTELKEGGIKFERRRTDKFWDIEFKNGVLMIPRLLIHDGTKSLFLNLIAFEQCQLDCTNQITSYVIFMDNLIDSAADVSYLHKCGIVENWLGSDSDVADLFNRLSEEVVFDINNGSLSRLSEEVNSYYDNKWSTWRATLCHKYFDNPWSVISFVAALVLLVLTVVQTFYAVYAYHRQP